MKEPIKSNSPLYQAGVSISIQDVQRHRRLLNYIKSMWRRSQRELKFPPDVNLILEYIPHLCFVPCFFLAYTCCRVGELKQIKMSNILHNKPFEIKSSKSKHIKQIPGLPDYNITLRQSLDQKTMIIVVSYDHLKNAIRQSKKRANLEPIENILDLTHIFRHYTATFMFNKGHSLDEISNKLGHLNHDTTLKYIH